MTQQALAKKSGVYFKFIGGIERGNRNATLKVLKKIATALGVSLGELFDYEFRSADPKLLRKVVVDEIKRCDDSNIVLLHRFLRSL